MARFVWKVADLRFTSLEEEARFRKHVDEGLCQFLVALGLIASTIMLVRTAMILKESGMTEDPAVLRDTGAAAMFLFYFLFSIVLTAGVGLVAFVHLRHKCLRLFNPELAGCLLALVLLAPVPFYNESHIAQIYGKQPAAVWGQDMTGCDLMSGLRIIAVVFIFTIGFSARFHVMSPVIVLGWVAFLASSIYFEADLPRYSGLLLVSVSGMFALALFLARKKELMLREVWQAQSRLDMQHRELKRRYKSTTSLLQRFCDSVVTISSDFRLKEHSSHLAALLLKQGGSTLEGANFCDFLASPEDREHFTAAMQRARHEDDSFLEPDAPDAAKMVLARLKDAHGTEFTVHIHHVCISTSKRTEHLIGIVESEARGAHVGAGNGQEDQVGELVQLASPQHNQLIGGGAPATMGGDADAASSSAGDSSLASSVQSFGSSNDNALQVDFFVAAGMRLAFQSAKFTETFGKREAGSGFRSLLEDPVAFESWLEEKKASLVAGSLSLPALIDFGVVKVQGQEPSAAQDLFLTICFPTISPSGSLDAVGFVQAGCYRVSTRFDALTSSRARKWKRRQRHAQLPAVLRDAEAQGAQGALAALRASRRGQGSSVVAL